MRKRRRLADKLMIMMCAVLIAVSAFFYAPMDVEASDYNVELLTDNTVYPEIMPLSYDETGAEPFNRYIYYLRGKQDSVRFDFTPYIDGEGLYKISLDITPTYYCSSPSTWWRHLYITVYNNGVDYTKNTYGPATAGNSFSFTTSMELYVHSDYPSGVIFYGGSPVWTEYPGLVDFNFSYEISNVVATKVTSEDSSDYQDGYNAGYSAGEQAGYGNGYSNGFADGEASVDTDAIYDEAFQAGKDSVDTDSYYDAGYQAGYQVAYSEGYESGYDEGYQSAMDRIDGWGADTSNYPLLVFDKSVYQPSVYVDCMSNIPGTSYGSTSLFHLDFDVNPNHTYKFVFGSIGYYADAYNCLFGDKNLGYTVGDLRFSAVYNTSWQTNTVFIRGDSVGSVVNLDAYVYEMRYYGGVDESNSLDLAIGQIKFGTHGNVTLKVYDYGPSGDTQNHIANQTDSLTNGFDNSQGNSVNSDLSSGLDDYQTVEDSLWATATTGLKDFTFFDFASVPAMITGMSFITAIMGSWFNQAGGASGVGIVLSILFSVILVSMVLGLYRWYQSRGGKD